MKNKWSFLVCSLYIIYFVALFFQNDVIGDLLSPLLTFLAFLPLFWGYFLKEKSSFFKVSGLLLSLSVFTWFLCDFFWGLSSLVLQVDPEENFWIVNGYSLTNLFLLLSLIVSGIYELKQWNRMQIFLDTLMVSASLMILIWVFIFQKEMDNAALLLQNPVAMFSLITNFLIYGWSNIWFFSIREKETPNFLRIAVAGGIIFAITDMVYYYIYFYKSYEANSIIDGFYLLAFTFFGLSGYLKAKNQEKMQGAYGPMKKVPLLNFASVKKEVLFLLVPMLLLLFQEFDPGIMLFTVTIIMFYFIFTRYNQSNIYRDELLKKEKEQVLELEKRVDERTMEIVRVMSTDVITGLKNRRYFEEFLEKEIRNIGQHERIFLLYIDQNKYKSMKAIYGKYVAEKTLEEVGKRISKLSQKKDALLASYGDDIFVVAYKSVNDYDEAAQLALDLLNHCSDNYYIENHVLKITLNIGIACYPMDAKSMEALIRNADMAMMDARNSGFNVIKVYDQFLGNYWNKRDSLELKLKKANIDEEFSLQYQPQVLSEQGEIYGAEALLRWFTKAGEYIPPNEFIPITEENGMIISLGYWIIEQAAKQFSLWRQQGRKEISISVNVSIKQLMEEDFVERFYQILQDYKIDPRYFEIEITENVEIENHIKVQETLKNIRNLGISLAIDDFGTGYSSLYYLKTLEVDRIKIAKELIDQIENDVYSQSIVQMVITVAKVNQIRVIAEGVETREQWECLKSLGCDEIQGYLFSKPLKPEELEEKWLRRNESEL